MTCSYCGSITVADMLVAMRTPGTRFSGADWKYGWPHKFYLHIPCEPYTRVVGSTSHGGEITDVQTAIDTSRFHKFYSLHMIDATAEQFAEWSRVCSPLLGILFDIAPDGKLLWSAPRPGYQTAGVVGLFSLLNEPRRAHE